MLYQRPTALPRYQYSATQWRTPSRHLLVPSAVHNRCGKASHYDMLGVNEKSSVDDVKSAFRARAKVLHPDVNKKVGAHDEFMRVKEAYNVLSDAHARRAYDATLLAAERQHSSSWAGTSQTRRKSPAAAASRVTQTSWEYCMKRGTWVEVQVVVEEADSPSVDDADDAELDDLMSDLAAWSNSPNNIRSSFQSSTQANRKKRAAAAAAASSTVGAGAGRSAGGWQGPGHGSRTSARREALTPQSKEVLLEELQPQYRNVATQVFGANLLELDSLDELIELCETMEQLESAGIRLDVGAAAFRQSRR